MPHKYSGGCEHIHTHSDNEPIDNHTCHCSVCKRVTGQDTTHVVFFKRGDVAGDNLDGLNRQPFNDQNPDGPLELCTCATCGALIMLDDKQHRIRAIVPNLMGYDPESLPATYHALYDPASGAPKPNDGRPVYEGLRPDFVWPAPACRALHLVLCSDGTGNKAGSTPDTNVFKMYNAVDIHTDQDTDEAEQRTFYDVGVGTSAFAPWKAISGAVGAGFGQNVRDLYRFLAKNYEPDPADTKIFVFGFSRGAATVRAFTGFLHARGLVDGRNMSAEDLEGRIDQQFDKYKSGETTGTPPKIPGESHGRVPVHFVGVWDTVSALGAPKYGKPTGPLSWMIKQACVLIDNVVNLIHKHRSYQYGLNNEIKNAYQALAIDDERTSFRPMVWDERKVSAGNVVEQVWFAGMHSNVGGGYERGGLADVALDWMMERAAHHGLIFNVSDRRQIHNRANPLGLIRDSRAGVGIFYRYHPRNITELCQDGLEEDKTKTPRIHKSVLDRMGARVDSYRCTLWMRKT